MATEERTMALSERQTGVLWPYGGANSTHPMRTHSAGNYATDRAMNALDAAGWCETHRHVERISPTEVQCLDCILVWSA